MTLGEIKQMDCQNVVNAEQKRGVGQSTITHIIMIMNMMFRAAIENDLIQIHPMKKQINHP